MYRIRPLNSVRVPIISSAEKGEQDAKDRGYLSDPEKKHPADQSRFGLGDLDFKSRFCLGDLDFKFGFGLGDPLFKPFFGDGQNGALRPVFHFVENIDKSFGPVVGQTFLKNFWYGDNSHGHSPSLVVEIMGVLKRYHFFDILSTKALAGIFLLLLLLIATPARADITSGLVGWWKMDEASSGTCAGASVVDSSGSGNTGTCTGSPAWVAGQKGSGAMSFDGALRYVMVSDAPSLHINGDISLTAWFQTTDTGLRFILSDYDNAGCFLYISSGHVGFHGRDPDYRNNSTTQTFSDGKWHFLVGLRQGSVWKVYVDGVLLVSNDYGVTASIVSGYDWAIGVGSHGAFLSSTYSFIGSIDDVRIYNRALTASDVLELYYKASIGGARIGNARLGT